MNAARFQSITGQYSNLSVAVVGDFCLDRYFEIDPRKNEQSLETGLTVHNVVSTRSQPGGAGTIVNNLSALRVSQIFAVGAAGEDGEGFELRRALQQTPGASLDHFVQSGEWRTFTYMKPLLVAGGKPPEELNRLDIKNWGPPPASTVARVRKVIKTLANLVDAFILLDQVDVPGTSLLCPEVLAEIEAVATEAPGVKIIADSRHGLAGFPRLIFKMNASELARLSGSAPISELDQVKECTLALARKNGRHVFVTLAERGMVGAEPGGRAVHLPAIPVRGPIDIVGAGDAVTANLAAALVAGASFSEAMELAQTAASVVIHKLGTTGTATIAELQALLKPV